MSAYANCKMSTNIAHPEHLEIETSVFILLEAFCGHSNHPQSIPILKDSCFKLKTINGCTKRNWVRIKIFHITAIWGNLCCSA